MLTLALATALTFAAVHVRQAQAGAHPHLSPCVRAGHCLTVRGYAHRLVLHRWHSETEWRALDSIISAESGWNPCAVYPARRDCSYAGSNSCGLGQRKPCPAWMRGRLWQTRYRQVRDVLLYIAARYRTPVRALWFRREHGYY